MTVIMMMGLPGSGKSTFAEKWVNEKTGQRVRVNMDDLRIMTFGGIDHMYDGFQTKIEPYINNLCYTAIDQALSRGFEVIVDNLNIGKKHLTKLQKLANKYGHDLKVVYIHVPLEVAIERNRNRERSIPERRYPDIHNQLEKRITELNQLEGLLIEIVDGV